MVDNQSTTIAVLGGTGKEGSGLAMRWAMNGYKVIIGSRDGERAAAYAAEMSAKLDGKQVAGMSNPEAAKQADLVVLSVPYTAHQSTLEGVKVYLEGKILVDIPCRCSRRKFELSICRKGNRQRWKPKPYWVKV